MESPGSGACYLARCETRELGPQIWAPTWGPKLGVWDLAKNPIRNVSPFGFPTFMGVNRQDPEENPPGGVAKVEL